MRPRSTTSPAVATHVPLTRARSNLLLLLVALIWASAFVAQAIAARTLGSLMFTGLRFALGAAVVAPFAWREWRQLRARNRQPRPRDLAHIAGLGTLLFMGAAMQQMGMATTSVTNTGFLSALYIPLVPVLAWAATRQAPHWTTWIAAAGCVAGSWLLTGGGSLNAFHAGDWWVIASSLPWAVHVMLVGRAANRLHGAMLVACGQFVACSVLALALGLATEPSARRAWRRRCGPSSTRASCRSAWASRCRWWRSATRARPTPPSCCRPRPCSPPASARCSWATASARPASRAAR